MGEKLHVSSKYSVKQVILLEIRGKGNGDYFRMFVTLERGLLQKSVVIDYKIDPQSLIFGN
jgi:hypothetical protein